MGQTACHPERLAEDDAWLHLTETSRLERIMREGLRAQVSPKGWGIHSYAAVFLTRGADNAALLASRLGLEDPAVLAVEPVVEPRLIVPDLYARFPLREWRHDGSIGPERIRVLDWQWDASGSRFKVSDSAAA